MFFLKNEKKKIFLSTGGSGGHIFPAIAALETLREKYEVCIVSNEIYKKYSGLNYNYEIISSGKSLVNFFSLKNIFLGILESRRILKKYKPDLVIGFGCYATFPFLIACILAKTPFLLHEQNVCIGKTNRFFLKYATNILSSYPEIYGINFKYMEKIIYTGNPIRENIKKLYNLEYNLEKDVFNILIVGGSLGAKFFSDNFCEIFDEQHIKNKNIFVYHQVQQEYIKNVKIHYQKVGLKAEVSPFFSNIDEIYKKTHLVIARAGNGTLTEVSLCGIPIILVPLPLSANNHQFKNAKLCERNKGAIIVEEKNFNIKTFQKLLFDLIDNKQKLKEMSINIKKMSNVNANENILNVVDGYLNV